MSNCGKERKLKKRKKRRYEGLLKVTSVIECGSIRKGSLDLGVERQGRRPKEKKETKYEFYDS